MNTDKSFINDPVIYHSASFYKFWVVIFHCSQYSCYLSKEMKETIHGPQNS